MKIAVTRHGSTWTATAPDITVPNPRQKNGPAIPLTCEATSRQDAIDGLIQILALHHGHIDDHLIIIPTTTDPSQSPL